MILNLNRHCVRQGEQREHKHIKTGEQKRTAHDFVFLAGPNPATGAIKHFLAPATPLKRVGETHSKHFETSGENKKGTDSGRHPF